MHQCLYEQKKLANFIAHILWFFTGKPCKFRESIPSPLLHFRRVITLFAPEDDETRHRLTCFPVYFAEKYFRASVTDWIWTFVFFPPDIWGFEGFIPSILGCTIQLSLVGCGDRFLKRVSSIKRKRKEEGRRGKLDKVVLHSHPSRRRSCRGIQQFSLNKINLLF